jgi:hypothetical protein
MTNRALLACLVLSCVVPACDTSETRPYVPIYDPRDDTPVPITEFCALLARDSCAVLRPCCEDSPFAFDEGKCRLVAHSLCEYRRNRNQNAGLAYDPVMAGRCVHGTAALVRSCRLLSTADDPDAVRVAYSCGMVWHGEKTPWQECVGTGSIDCARCDPKHLECAPSDRYWVACEAGLCVAVELLEGGADCGAPAVVDPRAPRRYCGPGLVCASFGGSSRCTARYHPLDAPCRRDDECGAPTDDAYCDTSLATASRCRLLPQGGERCAPAEGRLPVDRRCAHAFKCDTDKDPAGVCSDAKPIGAACTVDAECASGSCYGRMVCMPGNIADPASCSGTLIPGLGGFAPVQVFEEGGG